MNSFTKGPWSQSHRKQLDGMYITQVYDSIGESICDLSWHAVNEGNGVTSTDRGANAHLIAAAPDMYAMLKLHHRQIEFRLDNDDLSECDRWDLRDSRQNIKDLLDKARGD